MKTKAGCCKVQGIIEEDPSAYLSKWGFTSVHNVL